MPRKKDINKQETEPFKEVGYPSVYMSNGYVVDDFLYELRGIEGIRTYQQMSENEAVISTMLFVIEMLIRSTKWAIVPAEESKEAEDIKDTIEEILFNDMESTWDDVLSKALTCLPYGWSLLEILWKKRIPIAENEDGETTTSKYDDGKIGIQDLKLRSQTTLDKWELSENKKTTIGMWQLSTIDGEGQSVLIPFTKAVLVRPYNKNDSPEGRSILRGSYESWFYLKNTRYQEGIAIERELNGLPVMEVPQALIIQANNGDETAQAALQSYQQLVRDVKFNEQGGAILPSDTFIDVDGNPTGYKKYNFSLLTSGGTRNIDTDKVITRFQTDILRTIALQFLYMSSGSRARSENESDFFLTAINGWNESIAETFNKQLITKIGIMNAFPQELLPTLQPTDVRPIDVTQVTTSLKDLAAAGAPLFPNIDLLNQVLLQLGLSEVKEEDIADFQFTNLNDNE